MAVGFFTISPERSKVADASSAFFYDNARILFRKRKQAQEPRSVFLGTFTGPLYLLLAGLFLGVVVMLTFIEWCAWCLQAEPTAAPTTRRRFLSRTLAGTEGMLAGLLNQCTFSLWVAEEFIQQQKASRCPAASHCYGRFYKNSRLSFFN